MNIRKKVLALITLLFVSLCSVIGFSLWNWQRLETLHITKERGQQLQLQSQEVMGLMKDIVFDLFAPTLYGQIRSLTYAPRSLVAYKTLEAEAMEYQHLFQEFMEDRSLQIMQDDELQDLYNTAYTLNRKALEKLENMMGQIYELQEIKKRDLDLYNYMQKDDDLISFFNDFQDTSYYFTNTVESYMNYFFESFQEQSERLEKQSYLQFLIMSIICSAIALTYALIFSREIIVKISLVEEAFEKIGHGNFPSENYDSHKPKVDHDELSHLLVKVNDLSVELKNSVDSILNITRKIGETCLEDATQEQLITLIDEILISDTQAIASAVYLADPVSGQFQLQSQIGINSQLHKELRIIDIMKLEMLKGDYLFISEEADDYISTLEFFSLPQNCFGSILILPFYKNDDFRGLVLSLSPLGIPFSDLGIIRMMNFIEFFSLSLDNHSQYLEVLEKREAQYQALQSQVQPHFIYNILNGFIGLNRLGAKERLENAIISLREMLRYVTDHNRWTTLGEELDFLRSYCELQKIRFSERISYDFESNPGLEDEIIPKLILQPLVENAILHGLEPQEEGGTVSIHSESKELGDQSLLIITVKDDGHGFDFSSQDMPGHVGLKNVSDRLKLCAPGSQLNIQSKIGEGCIAVVSLVTTNMKEHENEIISC